MMRLAFAATLILALALFLPGCPAFGCSAASYTGAGDRYFVNGANNNTILLCENGGFVAQLTNAVEGQYTQTNNDVVADDGPDQVRAFTLTIDQTNNTATSPELGGTWTEMTLDKTALDHADTQCQALETRSWWK